MQLYLLLNSNTENMKKYLIVIFILICCLAKAQIITYYPKVDKQGTSSVTIQKIDIRDNDTEISFSYNNDFPNDSGYIEIDPHMSIIAVGGRRIFKFLNTQNIPVMPARRQITMQGEEVLFKVRFEKLDPGIVVLDIFECSNYDNVTCFNFYGVHISNPIYSPSPSAEKNPDKPINDNNKPIVKVIPPKVIFTGRLLNSKTKKPVAGQITFDILPDETVVGNVKSNINTGQYKFTLTPDKAFYGYTASAKGYLADQENIDLTKITADKTFTKDILLKPIETGATIRLNNIFFPIGEYTLLSSSYGELNKLIKIMQDNPTMAISLEGHTDIIGNPDDNLKLSENRVKAVKEYLVTNGILSDRIQLKWYGGTKPIISKGTEEERKVNRRVEFKILKK